MVPICCSTKCLTESPALKMIFACVLRCSYPRNFVYQSWVVEVFGNYARGWVLFLLRWHAVAPCFSLVVVQSATDLRGGWWGLKPPPSRRKTPYNQTLRLTLPISVDLKDTAIPDCLQSCCQKSTAASSPP